MIFNCTSCCKAISSSAEVCPYCMIEIAGVAKEITVQKTLEEKKNHFQFLARKKMSNLSHLTRKVNLNTLRIARTHHI